MGCKTSKVGVVEPKPKGQVPNQGTKSRISLNLK